MIKYFKLYLVSLAAVFAILSPLVKLEPGASDSHQEMWDVFEGLDSLPSDMQKR